MVLGLYETVKRYGARAGRAEPEQKPGGERQAGPLPHMDRNLTAIHPSSTLHMVNKHKRDYARARNRVEESRLQREHVVVRLAQSLMEKNALVEANRMRRLRESLEEGRGKHAQVMRGKLPDYSFRRRRDKQGRTEKAAWSGPMHAYSFCDPRWEPLGRWVRYPPKYSYPACSRLPTRVFTRSPSHIAQSGSSQNAPGNNLHLLNREPRTKKRMNNR